MKKYVSFFIMFAVSAAILSSSTLAGRGKTQKQDTSESEEFCRPKKKQKTNNTTKKKKTNTTKQDGTQRNCLKSSRTIEIGEDNEWEWKKDIRGNLFSYEGTIEIGDDNKFPWNPEGVFEGAVFTILQKLKILKPTETIDSANINLISCDGGSGATVNILKVNEKERAAIKFFKNLQTGYGEYDPSAFTCNRLKSDSQFTKFKIASILAAFHSQSNPNEPFVILYEMAKGKTIYQVLTDNGQDNPEEVLNAATEYFANLHIASWRRKESNTYIRPESGQINDWPIFEWFGEKIISKIGAFTAEESNITKNWKEIAKNNNIDYMNFSGYLKQSFEAAKERCGKALDDISNNALLLTMVHGDAHLNNIFYDSTQNSFQKITLIDYSTMGLAPADPAEDIGRFVGSLWTWAAEQEECEANIDFYYNLVSKWQQMIIDTYIKLWNKGPREGGELTENECKKFTELLKENIKTYKEGYFRYFFIECQKNPLKEKEENLLNLWWKEIEKEGIPLKLKSKPSLDNKHSSKAKSSVKKEKSVQERPTKRTLIDLVETDDSDD